MHYRRLLGAIALSTTLWAATSGAQIFDFGKYPDLRGQWVRWGPSGPDLKGPLVRFGPPGFNGTRFDPSKPFKIPGASRTRRAFATTSERTGSIGSS
jgi:hypothetical protein